MSVVDLRPLVDQVIIPLAEAGIAPIVAWIAVRAEKFLRIQQHSKQADALEGAIWNAIHFGLNRAQTTLDGKASVHTKGVVTTVAVKYLLPKIPGILKSLGITPEGLRERVEARLEAMSQAPSVVVETSSKR